MPEELLRRLDKYCNAMFKGKPRIRNLVIRNAIEEFLNEHEGKLRK
jgi:metal-responsive CopG/Arc/MetJ family transcriptional regulator